MQTDNRSDRQQQTHTFRMKKEPRDQEGELDRRPNICSTDSHTPCSRRNQYEKTAPPEAEDESAQCCGRKRTN